MRIIYSGQEHDIEINAVGPTLLPNGHCVAFNGVLQPKVAEAPAVYTREQILAMTVAELDAVEEPLNIDGYYAMLKAEKQTAILEALGL